MTDRDTTGEQVHDPASGAREGCESATRSEQTAPRQKIGGGNDRGGIDQGYHDAGGGAASAKRLNERPGIVDDSLTDHVAVDTHAGQALTPVKLEPGVRAKEDTGRKLGKDNLDSEEGGRKRGEATAGKVPGATVSTEGGHVSSSVDLVHRCNEHDVSPGFPFIKRTKADGAQSLRCLDDEGERNPESVVHNRSKDSYRNRVEDPRIQGQFHEPRESLPDVTVASIPTKRKEGEERKSVPLGTAEVLVEELLSATRALGAKEEKGVGQDSLGEGQMEGKRSSTTQQARRGVFAESARGKEHGVAPGFPLIKRIEADGAQSLRHLNDEGECNPEAVVHNRSKGSYGNRVDDSRIQGHFHEPRESIPDVAVAPTPTKCKEGKERKSEPLCTAELLVEELLSGARALGAREEQGVGQDSLGEGPMEDKRSSTTKQARSEVFAEPTWIQGYDPTHDCYYYYHVPTSESTWHEPDEPYEAYVHSDEDDDKVMTTRRNNRTAGARATSPRKEKRNPGNSRKEKSVTGDRSKQPKKNRAYIHSGEDDDNVMTTSGDIQTAGARATSLRREKRYRRSSRKERKVTRDTSRQPKEGREARDGLRSHRNKHGEERQTGPASKKPSTPGCRISSRRTSSRKNDDVSCSSGPSRSDSAKIVSSYRSRDGGPREHRRQARDNRSISSSRRGVTVRRDRCRRSVRGGGKTSLEWLDDLSDENIDLYGGFSSSEDEWKWGGYRRRDKILCREEDEQSRGSARRRGSGDGGDDIEDNSERSLLRKECSGKSDHHNSNRARRPSPSSRRGHSRNSDVLQGKHDDALKSPLSSVNDENGSRTTQSWREKQMDRNSNICSSA